MTQADDSLAKRRFFALTAMRLMGAFFVLIGFVLIRGGWELAGQPTDRWIGVGVVLIGAFDFAVMPLLLARRWRSPKKLVKRFWKEVAVVDEDGGWGIALDGRPVRTPQRAPLAVASAALAEAIAAEWRDVGETIDPAAMPMTGLTNAAIDLATPDLLAFAAPVAAYAESDLFCYRDARDVALQAEQAAAWNPLLTWAEARYGIEFILTQGVLPVDQPATTIAALQDAVLAQDAWRITALTPLVTIGGSLVAGLALIENAFDAENLWNAVSLDDLYQERRWGADGEAQKARAAHKRDWDNAARFLTLL